ncbi:MAG: glucose-6-phosphate dehydrogenase [Candidatus Vogelbacteria bacterium RIFOXYD1_FULL_46_19]|uniref:Glucose-6-phosphate 1-dehydrogenase n=1 Tax=Candidatus Vogelbacteria bacterium RIFOXYD1_FULL_46_19 TaxID=1802439 RepID=A0A1G2QJE3_9BACT|nr:MAG: glucose-6-phosphate dehydrogenase [Candidatus Vogelbacteria bacterium RIFOXYD1_FULL_46_19]
MTRPKTTPLPPTIVVVFGITGDLARRKLLPAIFDLYLKGLLPSQFRLVGFMRRDLSKLEFQTLIQDSLTKYHRGASSTSLKKFLKLIVLEQGQFDDPAAYERLGEQLKSLDNSLGVCTNKLFYLAVPPALYPTIFPLIKKSHLAKACESARAGTGWTRFLVEKPFGRDLGTARSLERQLKNIFTEDQIFRIDHYLAKETLQNIITFRLANPLFANIWNRGHIVRVEVRLLEQEGIVGRGSFYDEVGALRDVGQNHLLQMLALVAMETPATLTAASIRAARERVLKGLKLAHSDFKESVQRGQYEGYLNESGVAPYSTTETYFKINATVTTGPLRGVPFTLESGKGLPVKKTEIKIYFKNLKLIPVEVESGEVGNVLTFTIQPNEGVALSLLAKEPGLDYLVTEKNLEFAYATGWPDRLIPSDYERLLFDALMGDSTLFPTRGEIIASWQFITPILNQLNKLPLTRYRRGDLPSVS